MKHVTVIVIVVRVETQLMCVCRSEKKGCSFSVDPDLSVTAETWGLGLQATQTKNFAQSRMFLYLHYGCLAVLVWHMHSVLLEVGEWAGDAKLSLKSDDSVIPVSDCNSKSHFM